MNRSHRSLYAAFDLFPTSKGASTHIAHMARFLFNQYDGGLLFTLGNSQHLENETEESIEIQRFNAIIANYLDRAQGYTNALTMKMDELSNLEMVHFRDIWSGLAILKKDRHYKTLFEVNRLPSVELPYRYNQISPIMMQKLISLELFCLEQSDFIITPSAVIKNNLVEKGIKSKKIEVVSNAADLNPKYQPSPLALPEHYILYFGAVQSWQGVDVLLRAFSLLKDLSNLKLIICCAGRAKYCKNYIKLAQKLAIDDQVIWKYQLDKMDLNTYIKRAIISIAPLKACSRNIEQGCSPLKIFESLACGTPVIASDLPVVREIIENGKTGLLVRPDRPQELSRAIRFLLENPEQLDDISKNGLYLIQSKYNWDYIRAQIQSIYAKL